MLWWHIVALILLWHSLHTLGTLSLFCTAWLAGWSQGSSRLLSAWWVLSQWVTQSQTILESVGFHGMPFAARSTGGTSWLSSLVLLVHLSGTSGSLWLLGYGVVLCSTQVRQFEGWFLETSFLFCQWWSTHLSAVHPVHQVLEALYHDTFAS